MKKTYNINISGKVFTIDEDAYNLLSDYLDTLEHAFSDNEEEAKELAEDIEYRISELLTERLTASHQSVVTISHIEEIISRIGRPEEILEMENEYETSGSAGRERQEEEIDVEINLGNAREQGVNPPPVPPVRKRLFRDPNNKIIGGVCGGIGAYFNIDPTWIRLCFVLLFFFTYSSVLLIYILLWIIVPDATTPLERMQMTGEAPTFENIGKNVTSFFKNEPKTESSDKPNGWKKFFDGVTNVCGIFAKIIIILISIIAFPVVLILALALLCVVIALIIYATSSLTIPNLPFEHSDTIWGLLCAIGFIIVIGIPLTMLVINFIRNSQSKTAPISNGWKTSLVITWIIGLILAGVSGGILKSRNTVSEFIEMRQQLHEVHEQIEEISASVADTTEEMAEVTDDISENIEEVNRITNEIEAPLVTKK